MLHKAILLITLAFSIVTYSQVPEAPEIDDQNETVVEIEEQIIEVPFPLVTSVPVYPGCTGNNKIELRKCTQENIELYVKSNLNLDLLDRKYARNGQHRISVGFKINRKGEVIKVRARAKTLALQEEVIRIVKSIPNMKPGEHRGKKVVVGYSLPLKFNLDKS